MGLSYAYLDQLRQQQSQPTPLAAKRSDPEESSLPVKSLEPQTAG
jgi:hypothetical protein